MKSILTQAHWLIRAERDTEFLVLSINWLATAGGDAISATSACTLHRLSIVIGQRVR